MRFSSDVVLFGFNSGVHIILVVLVARLAWSRVCFGVFVGIWIRFSSHRFNQELLYLLGSTYLLMSGRCCLLRKAVHLSIKYSEACTMMIALSFQKILAVSVFYLGDSA